MTYKYMIPLDVAKNDPTPCLGWWKAPDDGSAVVCDNCGGPIIIGESFYCWHDKTPGMNVALTAYLAGHYPNQQTNNVWVHATGGCIPEKEEKLQVIVAPGYAHFDVAKGLAGSTCLNCKDTIEFDIPIAFWHDDHGDLKIIHQTCPKSIASVSATHAAAKKLKPPPSAQHILNTSSSGFANGHYRCDVCGDLVNPGESIARWKTKIKGFHGINSAYTGWKSLVVVHIPTCAEAKTKATGVAKKAAPAKIRLADEGPNPLRRQVMVAHATADFYTLCLAERSGLVRRRLHDDDVTIDPSVYRAAQARIVAPLARAFFDYIVAASLGEAGNARMACTHFFPHIVGHRAIGAERGLDFDPKSALTALDDIFGKPWRGGYGGKPWRLIVKAGRLYGTVPDAVFIDHCVDLVHNGGLFLDKGMILRVENSGYTVLLDAKRDGEARDIIRALIEYGIPVSHDVMPIWSVLAPKENRYYDRLTPIDPWSYTPVPWGTTPFPLEYIPSGHAIPGEEGEIHVATPEVQEAAPRVPA